MSDEEKNEPEAPQYYAEDLVRFGSADWGLLKRLFVYLRPYWKQAVWASLLLLTTTVLLLLIPNVLKQFVDRVLVPGRPDRLYHYTWQILALVTGYALTGAAQGYLFQWLGQMVMYDLRRDLFAHTQRLPVRYFDKNPVGRLVTRVTNDIGSLNELFSGGFVQLINDVFTIVGILIAMFILEWRLAVWVALVFPPLVWSVIYISREIRVILREAKRLIARINAFLNEHITGIRIIQLFSREAERDRAFRGVVEDYTRTQYRLVSVQSYFLPISTLFAGIMGSSILWLGGEETLAGVTTVGTITAFLYYAQQLYFPIRTFTDKFNVLLLAFASAERIFTLMDEPAEMAVAAGPEKHAREGGAEIVFDDVTFGYTDDSQALRGVSFRIPPGRSVAVVGATGAGKSTLISLLVRYYENQQGRILLDGTDIREIDKQQIRRRVGVVPQDVFLFSGTLLDNLFLPAEFPEEERRAQAARIFEDLGCGEFLEKLPRGLDTEIAERGGNLSAGERQLVAFARMLCYDPEVVVLDEATANIDSATERLLQKATARLARGRTSILIAHRLSTVLGTDRILVLHHGKLVEEGSHEELLRLGGVYAKLYELQFAKAA